MYQNVKKHTVHWPPKHPGKSKISHEFGAPKKCWFGQLVGWSSSTSMKGNFWDSPQGVMASQPILPPPKKKKDVPHPREIRPCEGFIRLLTIGFLYKALLNFVRGYLWGGGVTLTQWCHSLIIHFQTYHSIPFKQKPTKIPALTRRWTSFWNLHPSFGKNLHDEVP